MLLLSAHPGCWSLASARVHALPHSADPGVSVSTRERYNATQRATREGSRDGNAATEAKGRVGVQGFLFSAMSVSCCTSESWS